MPVYTLPDLDYDHGALEPHVSAQIMELHHGKHHKAYVDNANGTLDKLAAAREKADFTAIAALERALAFNVSGHVMHSIFWKNLKPKLLMKIDPVGAPFTVPTVIVPSIYPFGWVCWM